MEIVKCIKTGDSMAIVVPPSVQTFLNIKLGDHVLWDLREKDAAVFKVKAPRRNVRKNK